MKVNSYIPTKKELSLSVCAATIGVIVFTLSVIIVVKSTSSLGKESLRADTATLGMNETFLIKKDLADWHHEISLLDSFFVNSGEEVDFIEKLEAVAKNSGVNIEISSISVNKKETGSNFIENLDIKVRFEGEWGIVVKFLKSVEAMPYVVLLGEVEANLLSEPLWKGEANISVLKIKNI